MAESEKRQRANVIDTQAEVLLREVDARASLAELKAKKSAQDLAAEKLPI